MNYYEHTIIARQDVSPTQLKQIEYKYIKIIENNEGNLLKTEKWGLLNLSYLIKKNKKGNYIHFKIEGNSKTVTELEKSEKIDKNLLRYLTIRVKKIDLDTNYFERSVEQKDINGKKEVKHKLNEEKFKKYQPEQFCKTKYFSEPKFKFKKMSSFW